MIVINKLEDIAPKIIKRAKENGTFSNVIKELYDSKVVIEEYFEIINQTADNMYDPSYAANKKFSISIYYDTSNDVFKLEPILNQTIKVVDFNIGFQQRQEITTFTKYILNAITNKWDFEEFNKKTDSLIRRNITNSIKNIFDINYVPNVEDVILGNVTLEAAGLTIDDITSNYLYRYEPSIGLYDYHELYNIFLNKFIIKPNMNLYNFIINIVKSHYKVNSIDDVFVCEPFLLDVIKDIVYKSGDIVQVDNIEYENFYIIIRRIEDLYKYYDVDKLKKLYFTNKKNNIVKMSIFIENNLSFSKFVLGNDNIIEVNSKHSIVDFNIFYTPINLYNNLIIFPNQIYCNKEINFNRFKYIFDINFFMNIISVSQKNESINIFKTNMSFACPNILEKKLESQDVMDIFAFYDGYDKKQISELLPLLKEEIKLLEKSVTKDFLKRPLVALVNPAELTIEHISIDKLKYIYRIKSND